MPLSFERVLAELGETFAQPPIEPAAGVESGVVNAYVYNHVGPLIATLAAGTMIRFTPGNTNTGPSTINVNGTGVANIIRANGSALTGGELSSLGPVVLQSTGTQWQIVSTAGAQPGYERTASEVTAGVVPVNYNYLPYYWDRYGTNTTPGTTDMTAAITASNNSVAVLGGTSYGLGNRYKVTSTVICQNNVIMRGVGGGPGLGGTLTNLGGTVIDHNVTGGVAVQLGENTVATYYGCGFRDINIRMHLANTTALLLSSTISAQVKNVTIVGDAVITSFTGVVIQSGTTGSSSNFFNVLENIYCLYIHAGYVFQNAGGNITFATQSTFIQCSCFGNKSVDGTSVGVTFNGLDGSGCVFYGGDFEQCGTGVLFSNTTAYTQWFGVRFENNTVDINWGNNVTVGRNTFFGPSNSLLLTGSQADNQYYVGQFIGPNAIVNQAASGNSFTVAGPGARPALAVASGGGTTFSNTTDNAIAQALGTGGIQAGLTATTGAGPLIRVQRYAAGSASQTIGGGYYFGVGTQDYNAAPPSYQLVGFGYAANTSYPAFVGYRQTSAAGNTLGDLIFGTRSVTTDTQPTINAALLSTGDWVSRGIAICLRATTVETRTSTTTLTNSTQLTYVIPGAGTYEFELEVFSYFTTAVTDGITANVNFSGSFTAVGSYLDGWFMNGTTTTTGIQPVQVSATVNNALTGLTLATYGASVSSTTPAVHYIKGTLIATATGTLAFAFAQSTSGVDTANLGVGSYMKVTQLS